MLQVKVLIEKVIEDGASAGNILTIIGLLGFCVGLPILTGYLLFKNYDELRTNGFKSKFIFVYKGVELHNGKNKVLYYSTFLGKRILLVLLTIAFR